ncbi:MAG: SWIM zinc finger family protein [Deltaproteobacteria bacterium]|nr:SWIM zinc finger family protein [Deltaproteobacteria bacterium]
MSRFRWSPYVPVAVRRARAMKKVQALRKNGVCVQPIEIEGRKIARTFWGEAWCRHLEQFSDFENRLPRGRTYVRNGSVCHLEIQPGTIQAMVSGSELYNVTIRINKLPSKKWKDVKGRCAGRIGSLLELLQGRLSKGVMEVVTDPGTGLFPLPKEIGLDCSCPDRAVMCKHVAAVLYGVGARLDQEPALLFLLRGVNEEELIAAGTDAAATVDETPGPGRIAEGDLSELFGIDMAEEATEAEAPVDEGSVETGPSARVAENAPAPEKTLGQRLAGARRRKKKAAAGQAAGRPKRQASSRRLNKEKTSADRTVTGKEVARLRKRFAMTQGQFARLLGVSPPSVGNWEKRKGRLNLQARTQRAWDRARALTRKEAWARLDDAG